jgi:sulfate adenylyltransferase subunit 2
LSETLSAHLRDLEAEAIYVLREVAAQFAKPVLLYSIGKNSSVLLHLARKAFFPAKPAFPLLHVNTGWKFRDMIAFRDATVTRLGLELIVYVHEDGVAQNINPIDSGSALHTRVMKTEALKCAVDRYGFDAAIGGSRRDEEASRAKERVFSVRGPGHTWDPRRQRPELWNLFNGQLAPGRPCGSFRSRTGPSWTCGTTSAPRTSRRCRCISRPGGRLVRRGGMLIMVDDERLPLANGEEPVQKMVHFRSLGCYPLTAAIESEAATLDEVIAELRETRRSERAGRLIDLDETASMERKKREGYF